MQLHYMDFTATKLIKNWILPFQSGPCRARWWVWSGRGTFPQTASVCATRRRCPCTRGPWPPAVAPPEAHGAAIKDSLDWALFEIEQPTFGNGLFIKRKNHQQQRQETKTKLKIACAESNHCVVSAGRQAASLSKGREKDYWSGIRKYMYESESPAMGGSWFD